MGKTHNNLLGGVNILTGMTVSWKAKEQHGDSGYFNLKVPIF